MFCQERDPEFGGGDVGIGRSRSDERLRPLVGEYSVGTRRDQGIEINDANHWLSDALVTFTDTHDTTVPPSGCTHVTAERMQ